MDHLEKSAQKTLSSERTMKINMHGWNDRKRNEIKNAIGAQNFWKVRKMKNSKKI